MEDGAKNDSETTFFNAIEDNRNIDPEVAAFVYDYLQYKLSQNGYQFRVPPNLRETGTRSVIVKAGIALRNLADEFSSQFKDQFLEMCEKLEINADTMKPTIEGVANELFSEGIKWARIVALFVFGSELATHCKNHNVAELINLIAHALAQYVSERLLPWIHDHGGWEGLISFDESGRAAEADAEQQSNNRWPSVKNLLCLGISALGALTIGAVLTKS